MYTLYKQVGVDSESHTLGDTRLLKALNAFPTYRKKKGKKQYIMKYLYVSHIC